MEKKKKIEKLKLNRETVLTLAEDSLREAQGGVQTHDKSCILSCPLAC